MHKATADQRGALRVSRIPPEQKNCFMRGSAYMLNTEGVKTRQVALWEILLSAEIRTQPEQLCLEHLSSKEQ
jgi:hypothetical protein